MPRVDEHGSHHLDAAQLACVAHGAPGAMARFLALLGLGGGGDDTAALLAEWAAARGVRPGEAAEDMHTYVLEHGEDM